MDCKDWGKKKEKFGKGAKCKEKVKQKKSAGKEENVKRQRSFGKEDFYENEVKRRRNAEQGRKITRGGQPATQANASSYGKCQRGRSGRQYPQGKASVCEQRMRAGSARRENDNRRRK